MQGSAGQREESDGMWTLEASCEIDGQNEARWSTVDDVGGTGPQHCELKDSGSWSVNTVLVDAASGQGNLVSSQTNTPSSA